MVKDHRALGVDWMFAGLRESGIGVGGISHTTEDIQVRKLVVIRSKELWNFVLDQTFDPADSADPVSMTP